MSNETGTTYLVFPGRPEDFGSDFEEAKRRAAFLASQTEGGMATVLLGPADWEKTSLVAVNVGVVIKAPQELPEHDPYSEDWEN